MPGPVDRSGVGPARSPLRGPALLGALLACAAVACAPAARPPTPGPTSAAAVPITGTVTVPGVDGDRTAVVHHPATAGPGAPLVLVLHGAGGSGADVRTHLGWDGLADREGFVVAYPEGLDHTWNAGGCCGGARDRGVDDVAFLDTLTADLRAGHGVGPVYAVGFSNGAMMSYAWACARPGALAGIGPVAGALVVDCPAPAPLTVVAVHGTEDERVPIEGGRGPSGVSFRSLDASLDPFRTGCAATPVREAPPARVGTWACPDGRSVTGVVVDGLPHTWPGAGPDAGTTDGPLDATGFLWAHLRG